MAIPESQLETWSHQGAITTASNTHQAVKNALLSPNSPLTSKTFDVSLQGSYKNDTNIRGDSDVDVVAELQSTFQRDISELSAEDQTRYNASYGPAAYSYSDFRQDVLAALQRYFGQASIKDGRKAICVLQNGSRLPADVLPCLQYRRYTRFKGFQDESYVEGIIFWSKSGREIINYPKPHYRNGVAKQDATSQRFKRTVRIFKNARTYLADHGRLGENVAPSYFVENLIYNVPDTHFAFSLGDSFVNVVNWLNAADLSKFPCQHGQTWLFGPTEEQWDLSAAQTYVRALIDLWNNW